MRVESMSFALSSCQAVRKSAVGVGRFTVSLAPAAQQIFEFAGITVVLLRTAARDFHWKQFWALSDSKNAPSGMRRRVSSLVQAGPPPKFEGSVDAQ
jgi:hypothetical protein